jgi:gluconolactonase
MYVAPPELPTERFAQLPAAWHRLGLWSSWIAARGAGPLHSFLEGPAFDRQGYLYCTDLAHGRIFKVAPTGEFAVFADYGGEPNGLKIHRDGRVFVADRKHGIVVVDGEGGVTTAPGTLPRGPSACLQGVNDLLFASNGDLWFTDQGDSALNRPTGRVYRLRACTGELQCAVDGLAGPNGLAFSPDERVLYVAITRDNAIYSIALSVTGEVGKMGRFIQLSGSPTGPDGLAVDEQGNLAIVHAGAGTVWQFSADGEPLLRIRSCAGRRVTNIAYGGTDRRTLFITEAGEGVVLAARMPYPGLALFSHKE